MIFLNDLKLLQITLEQDQEIQLHKELTESFIYELRLKPEYLQMRNYLVNNTQISGAEREGNLNEQSISMESDNNEKADRQSFG